MMLRRVFDSWILSSQWEGVVPRTLTPLDSSDQILLSPLFDLLTVGLYV